MLSSLAICQHVNLIEAGDQRQWFLVVFSVIVRTQLCLGLMEDVQSRGRDDDDAEERQDNDCSIRARRMHRFLRNLHRCFDLRGKD